MSSVNTNKYLRAVLIQSTADLAIRRFQSRGQRFNSIADGFSSLVYGLHTRSVASQLLKQLSDPKLLQQINKQLNDRPEWGVLVVVDYQVADTPIGKQYSQVYTHVGPSAPNVSLAIYWERNRPTLRAAPISWSFKLESDFIWVSPDGGVNLNVNEKLPENACMIDEVFFLNHISPQN